MMEHVLARLRRKFELKGVRQSRFSAWSFFSKEVAEKACADIKDCTAAAALTKFIPSCHQLEDGSRKYQVIVVRLHLMDKPKFARVEEILRGSIKKKRRGGKKLCESPLDAAMVGCVRAVFLEPQTVDKDGSWIMTCTCRSPSAVLQVDDDDGVILWNVPDDQFQIEETPVALIFTIQKPAVEATKSAFGKGTVPVFKAPEGSAPKTSVSYTKEAFKSKKVVMQYVHVMQKMLQKNLGGQHGTTWARGRGM